jgi:acetyl/propionyl-CoA carboxylase alpha subunit
MRKVEKSRDFKAALQSAKREAASAFGDDRVLLEMYVQRPRHIEVQVFGDTHGNVVHLFERDCSLQRRHQKVIEEAPAPGMDEATRAAICAAAVKAARAVNYVNAGTVEFIADASEGLRADRVWFMEMNTRLQVEHPVTEEITGQDLVEWQLRVASGETLPLRQEELKINGWAMEARLYAEDPASGFLPSTGEMNSLWRYNVAESVRIDTALDWKDEVTPFYDPMIAKVITHGADRITATDELRAACAKIAICPVKTNAGFLVRCLEDEGFRQGNVDTALIASRGEALTAKPAPSESVLRAAAHEFMRQSHPGEDAPRADFSPWTELSGFRLNAEPDARVRMRERGRPFSAAPIFEPAARIVEVSRDAVVVFDRGEAYEFTLDTGERAEGEAAAGGGAILSPMPGKVVAVNVKANAKVKKGDALLVLEAMKMEHTLTAPFDGVVCELNAKTGAQVSEGVLLAKLEAPE